VMEAAKNKRQLGAMVVELRRGGKKGTNCKKVGSSGRKDDACRGRARTGRKTLGGRGREGVGKLELLQGSPRPQGSNS
jgi:hypothetical protein